MKKAQKYLYTFVICLTVFLFLSVFNYKIHAESNSITQDLVFGSTASSGSGYNYYFDYEDYVYKLELDNVDITGSISFDSSVSYKIEIYIKGNNTINTSDGIAIDTSQTNKITSNPTLNIISESESDTLTINLKNVNGTSKSIEGIHTNSLLLGDYGTLNINFKSTTYASRYYGITTTNGYVKSTGMDININCEDMIATSTTSGNNDTLGIEHVFIGIYNNSDENYNNPGHLMEASVELINANLTIRSNEVSYIDQDTVNTVANIGVFSAEYYFVTENRLDSLIMVNSSLDIKVGNAKNGKDITRSDALTINGYIKGWTSELEDYYNELGTLKLECGTASNEDSTKGDCYSGALNYNNFYNYYSIDKDNNIDPFSPYKDAIRTQNPLIFAGQKINGETYESKDSFISSIYNDDTKKYTITNDYDGFYWKINVKDHDVHNFSYGVCSECGYDLINEENLILPQNSTIGENAFNNLNGNCSNLKTIILPDGITSIGKNAFKDCTNLNSINIPLSVTSIEEGAFSGCTSIKNIYFDGSIEDWNNLNCAIDGRPNSNAESYVNFYLKDSSGSVSYNEALYKLLNGSIDCKNFTKVSDYAFFRIANITSIDISGTTLNTIGDFSFAYTEILKLEIGDNITLIGESAFQNCKKLNEITTTDHEFEISKLAFSGLDTGVMYLTDEVIFLDTNLGTYPFYDCADLIIYFRNTLYDDDNLNPNAWIHKDPDENICGNLGTVYFYSETTPEYCGYIYWYYDQEHNIKYWPEHFLTHYDKVDATCTTVGSKEYWQCSICQTKFADSNGYNNLYNSEIAIDPNNHEWTDIEYTWYNNNYSCNATAVCAYDSTHTIFENTLADYYDVSELTCEIDWVRSFTATFTNSIFSSQIKENVLMESAKGHTWGTPTYTWNEDHSLCIAQINCTTGIVHSESESGAITYEVIQNRTCSQKEITRYVATFTKVGIYTYTNSDGEKVQEEKPFFETKSVEVETALMLGHDAYNTDPIWSEDYKTCTIKRICRNDNQVLAEETVNSTYNITQALGCENDELATYTAVFKNKDFTTQVKENITLRTAIGHNYEVSYTWNSDNTICMAKRICKNDASDVLVESGVVTKTIKQKGNCETDEIISFSAKFTNDCFKTQECDVTTPSVGHVDKNGDNKCDNCATKLSKNKETMSSGSRIAISISAVVVIIGIITLTLYILKRKHKKNNQNKL